MCEGLQMGSAKTCSSSASRAYHLRGDHRVAGGVVVPDLQLAAHLAPDARVAPVYLAAVVAEGALREEEEEEEGGQRTSLRTGGGGGGVTEGRTHGNVVTLSDVGAQDAGDHAAEVQQGHAAAPAVVRGRLALEAGEAEQPAATWGGGKLLSVLPQTEGARPIGPL